MRIVIVGAVEFTRTCIREVLRQGGEVVGIVSVPWYRAKFSSDYVDLEPVARAHGIPYYSVARVSDPESIEIFRNLKPDVIFVFGFSQLIPKELLELPNLGCIGTHPALLPKHRGRHPLIWALVQGWTESGLSFFFLSEEVDDGDILWQERFEITLEDNAGSLYEKISTLAVKAIGEFLPRLESGDFERIPQDDSQATTLRKRSAEDGEIQWDGDAMTVYNLVRALTTPYPGAHTWFDGKLIRVWRAELVEEEFPNARAAQPGRVLDRRNRQLYVATGEGVIRLRHWECEEDHDVLPDPGDRLGVKTGDKR